MSTRVLGAVVAAWPALAPPAWRSRIEIVCIDLYSIYALAVRWVLAHATLAADLFHVMRLAVKAVGGVRRRVVRARYERRGRSGDPRSRLTFEGPGLTPEGWATPANGMISITRANRSKGMFSRTGGIAFGVLDAGDLDLD